MSDSDDDERVVKYTSDGLSDTEYFISNVVNQYLTKAECCQYFFKPDAYAHQTLFKLSIQGMNTCIHCYISYNLHKFTDCKKLSKIEDDCLWYYIDNFTDEHDLKTCTRKNNYGKCLLCESKVGIKPKQINNDNTLDVVELKHGSLTDDLINITTTDIVLIGNNNSRNFMLIL